MLCAVLISTIGCQPQAAPVNPVAPELSVREPAVAGQFYPADAQELRATIDAFLDKAAVSKTEGTITALILPHAGYPFSGQVAAYGYKELIGEEVDTVILIGNSHREQFPGASIFPDGIFKTPLGNIEVDAALAKALMTDDPQLTFRKSAHINEHSLEVQLPFLQKTLKSFRIVPILLGNHGGADHLAHTIAKNIRGKNVLVIASSDLSHYPAATEAKRVDEKVMNAILTGDTTTLDTTVAGLEAQKIPGVVTFACGMDAIKVVMAVEKELGATEIKRLNAANSGDVSRDQSRVVGYATIAFFAPRRGELLSRAEEDKLLAVAKASVESYVRDKTIPHFQFSEPALNARNGAFVTLKSGGTLRGCLGQFSPSALPLTEVVSKMAIAAATEDTRFKPVTADELEKINYEISVLSPLQKVHDASEIILGKHGVKLSQGSHSGVFLPQVATEMGWTKDAFMGELCAQKAGLNRDCWKDTETRLYTFTAQVFSIFSRTDKSTRRGGNF